jgi:hypothetical protein
LSSFQHNQTNTHITIRHPDDDDAELTHAKKRQKYSHLPRMASLMASTYCAGTQYTQYLDASVGPSWIPYKKINNPALLRTECYYSHETNDSINMLTDCITLSNILSSPIILFLYSVTFRLIPQRINSSYIKKCSRIPKSCSLFYPNVKISHFFSTHISHITFIPAI